MDNVGQHNKTNIAAQRVATFLEGEGVKVDKITLTTTTQGSAYINLKNGKRVQVTLYQPFVVRNGIHFVAMPESAMQLLKAVVG